MPYIIKVEKPQKGSFFEVGIFIDYSILNWTNLDVQNNLRARYDDDQQKIWLLNHREIPSISETIHDITEKLYSSIDFETYTIYYTI